MIHRLALVALAGLATAGLVVVPAVASHSDDVTAAETIVERNESDLPPVVMVTPNSDDVTAPGTVEIVPGAGCCPKYDPRFACWQDGHWHDNHCKSCAPPPPGT